MSTGMFLSLDGMDGVGKSTQCRLLVDWLDQKGFSVVACRDPGGTVLGEKVRAILLDHHMGAIDRRAEMLLYMASRAQLTAEIIRPALERGSVVVSDRYLLANVVYQGYGGGLAVDRLWEVGRLATGELLPDLTLLLDLEVATARQRQHGLPDRMESESAEFFQRVRDGFLNEARQSPQSIEVIAAQGTVEAIHQRLIDAVGRKLAARGLLREGSA